jgi:DNA-binding transcriptional MocR family regulator
LIFSPCTRYENFMRLSFGHPWSEEIEQSIAWLGQKVQQLAGERPRASKSAKFCPGVRPGV